MSRKPLSEIMVPMVLPYYQARAVRTAVARAAKNFERLARHDEFVPKKGHVNLTQAKAINYEHAVKALDAALDIALHEWEVANAQE